MLEGVRAIDYVSEAYYRALALGVVPVYLGAPNIVQRFSPGRRALIDIGAYDSLEQVMCESSRKVGGGAGTGRGDRTMCGSSGRGGLAQAKNGALP